MEVAAMNDREVLLEMFNLPEDAKALIQTESVYSDNDGKPVSVFDAWYDRHASFREMVPLSQFRPKLLSGEVGNFVYYRSRGMVFNTLVPADHADFMSGLYSLHMLANGARKPHESFDSYTRLGNMFCSRFDGQDNFLKEGLGVYQSSCGKHLFRHQNMALDGQEKIVFQDMEQHIYDY